MHEKCAYFFETRHKQRELEEKKKIAKKVRPELSCDVEWKDSLFLQKVE